MNGMPRRRSRRARGGVAVEMAIILPIIVTLLNAVVFFGWIFWHYTVAEKAAHDAATFLARVNAREIQTSGGGAEAPIVGAARRIAQEEVRELNPGGGVGISILCQVGDVDPYWETCFGFEKPRRVMVRVTVALSGGYVNALLATFTHGEQVLLRAVMATDYVGT